MQSFHWPDHADELLRGVNYLYGGNEIFDCEVECFDGLIQGHKVILAACSPYLMNEFKRNSGNGCIQLKGVKCFAVHRIFDFVYRGHMDVPSSEVADVIEVAKLLQITSLEKYYSLNKSDYKNNKIFPENKYVWERDVDSETDSIANEPFEAVYVQSEMQDSALSDTENQILGEGAMDCGTVLDSEQSEAVESKIEVEEFGGEDLQSPGCDMLPRVEGLKLERAVEDDLPVSTSPGGSSCGLGASQSHQNVQEQELNTQPSTSTKSPSGCCSDICDELEFPVEGAKELVSPTSNVGVLSCYVNGIGKEKPELGNKLQMSQCDRVASMGKEIAAYVENTADVSGKISLPPSVSHRAENVVIHKSFLLESSENPETEEERRMKIGCKEVFGSSVSNVLESCSMEKSVEESFVCHDCGQQFETSDKLALHLRMHFGEKPRVDDGSGGDKSYRCRECDRVFTRRSSLVNHVRMHTRTPGTLLVCSVCGASFREKQGLRRHMFIHTGVKPFPCSLCDKQFMSNVNLKLHFRVHTGEVCHKPYKCGVCEKTYANRYYLANHLRTHSGERPFECSVCCATFREKVFLKRHMVIHTEAKQFACSLCEKRFTRDRYLKLHLRTHTDQYVCKVCRNSFSCSDDLKQHMLKHALSCNECGKTFLWVWSLKKHMVIHRTDKPFECAHCGAKYPLKERLARHITSRHTEKTFKCTLCPSSFLCDASLIRHMRVHTGDKPYVCSYCNARFTDKSNFTVHLRIHTGEKPFVCRVCGRAFRETTSLTMHMRLHTGERPFKCDLCEKSFIRKQRLKEHHRTHTGEKPHVCDVCGKGFRLRPGLTKHLLSHTGERPHLCSHCGLVYRLRKSLRLHMKLKHPSGKEEAAAAAAGSVE